MPFQFHDHSAIVGTHALLSPSNYHWINYSDEKLIDVSKKQEAVKKGIEDHEFAATCIRRKQKLPKSQKTLNSFVNDAIGYRMTPEQPLYFSENAFGTSDAISFDGKLLRIHDLKTGETPASMTQLQVYAALFCLEYGVKPGKIDIELRIYQFDEIAVNLPATEEIVRIADKIVHFDKILRKLKEEEL